MGEQIRLKASDGHQLDAYLARPAGQAKAGLVICQEVFGVNDHIRDVADDYAGNGYMTLAPSLFDRVEREVELDYGPDALDRGRSLRGQLDWDDIALDVQAAVEKLRAELGPDAKVGVIGFAWGGAVAWLAACRLKVNAAVSYYSGQIFELNDEEPQCPTLLHFGEEDPIVDFDQIEAIRAEHPNVVDHIYEAGHGFNNDRTEDYDEASAQLARSRTIAFLIDNLGT
jgi:carboxymethylenebutenolidase